MKEARTDEASATPVENYISQIAGLKNYSEDFQNSLKIRLSKQEDGSFDPAAILNEPYLIIIDDMLTDPHTLMAIKNEYLEAIMKLKAQNKVDKLCFIEKDFGPAGAILLTTSLTCESALPRLSIDKDGGQWVAYSKVQ